MYYGCPWHLCFKNSGKIPAFIQGWMPAREFFVQKGKNWHSGDCHSEEIVDSVQNIIDNNLGTSIRQIWRLLGNIDWLVRKIGKEEIGHNSQIIHHIHHSLLAMQ